MSPTQAASLSVGFAVPGARRQPARRNCSRASLLSQSLALGWAGTTPPGLDAHGGGDSSSCSSPQSARCGEAGTPPPAVELDSEASEAAIDSTLPVTINYDR